MSVQEYMQSEEDRRTARERERRRWEVAKALFVRLMAEDIAAVGDDADSATYRDIACQAVTAADEFMQRFYEPESDVSVILPPYEG